MNKILIIFAHPAAHKSKINRELIESVKTLSGVTVNDLYENYPDFFIDVKREQKQLIENDIIIWHHPFYWYSCPSLMKEWIDLVLEHGFAYGRYGNALHGKMILNSVTTGGKAEVYSETGRNHYTISQFLIPFHQTAMLCGMKYLPPFVIHDAHNFDSVDVKKEFNKYRKLIIGLRDGLMNDISFRDNIYLNHLITED